MYFYDPMVVSRAMHITVGSHRGKFWFFDSAAQVLGDGAPNADTTCTCFNDFQPQVFSLVLLYIFVECWLSRVQVFSKM